MEEEEGLLGRDWSIFEESQVEEGEEEEEEEALTPESHVARAEWGTGQDSAVAVGLGSFGFDIVGPPQ